MCLKTVDKDTKQVTEGWKMFEVKNNKLYGLFKNMKFEHNKWIKDLCKEKLYSLEGNIYKTGFHFYLNKKDAEYEAMYWRVWNEGHNFVVKKVKVRNVTATGKQNGHRVGVSREIFIEEESCV